MKKSSIFLLLGILVILVVAIIIFRYDKGTSDITPNQFISLKSGIIKISEGQGDEVYDDRLPADVCSSMLKQVQDSNPSLKCEVVDSSRVDNPQDPEKECPTDYSITGCFSCTLDCK